MKTLKILLGISLFSTLSGMEDSPAINPALKKEIINYIRSHIIIKNGKTKQYTPHQRESFQKCYHVATDHDGHKCVLPQCLVKNNDYIFNGPKLSTNEQHRTSDTYKMSPDGNHLAQIITTNEFQDTVILTNLTTQSSVPLFTDQKLTMALCFSPDSSTLFTGGTTQNKELQEWNINTQQLITAISHPATITAITFNHAGNAMVTCGSDTTHSHIQLWQKNNVGNYLNKTKISYPGDTITHAYFNKSDDTILVTMINGVMVLLNASDGTIITSLETIDSTRFKGIVYPVFMHNDQFLATINHYYPTSLEKNSFITLWETKGYTKLSSLKTNLHTCGIGLTPDKRSLVATFADLTMHKTDLFDDKTHQSLRYLKQSNDKNQWAALYTLYLYQKNGAALRNENVDTIHEALQSLPIEPNIRGMIQHYLDIKK